MLRLSVLLFILPVVALAQQDIRLQQIGVKDGLSQGDIKCMVQDNDGFMWIGSRDGLNKYDGSNFIQYGRRFNDSTSLYFNQILDLKLDQKGNVWIASVGGISCFNKGTDTFRNYLMSGDSAGSTRVNNLFVENEGSLVLSTSDGLKRFDIEHGTFRVASEYPVAAHSFVTQFHSDANTGTWIATDKGLFVKRPTDSNWNTLFEGINVIHLNFAGNRTFVSTMAGFYTYQFTDNTTHQITLPFATQFANQSLLTNEGELWVACNQVVVFDATDFSVKHVISRKENSTVSLTEDRARVLYQSKDGIIWIGTFGYGLNKHDPQTRNFHYLGMKSSIALSSNYVSTILTNDDNTLFIGTTRGLNVVDLAKKTNQFHFRTDGMFLVFKLKKDSNGVIWASTSNGISKYEGKEFVRLNFNGGEALDFTEWEPSTLLIATRYRGLYLLNKYNGSARLLSSPDIVKEVTSFLVQKDRVWVGGQDGLRLLSKDGRLIRHFKSRANNMSSLHSNVIKCIIEDRENNLWIGTWGGGLSRYNEADSTFTTIDQSNGLPNSTVYGVIQDRKGFLWLSTNMGISRFNPHDMTFKNFDFASGLQGDEFNTGAYFKSPNDIIYMGGTDGLTFFNPDSVSYDAPATSVLITDVSINSTSLAKDLYAGSINSKDELQLTWTRTNIGIGFTSVDYRNADKIIFQFSMDDDTTWSPLDGRKNLELVNLPSGRHVLHLRAKRIGDRWGPPTSLAMYVNPAFWRSTSFIVFIGALVIFGAYIFYKFRVSYLTRINTRLQKLVEDRTREIQLKNEEISAQNEELTSNSEKLALLNDELEEKIDERTKNIQQLNTDLQEQNRQLEQFSFITAHNFRGPLARIKGLINLIDTEPKENLRQVVSYLKLSADNLEDVIQDLNKILEIKKEGERQLETVELLPELRIALSIVEEDLISKKIQIDISDFHPHSIRGHRSYVHSIFSNLLVNSVKYADSTRNSFIKIICIIENHRVRIDFIDNGVGFDLSLASSKLFMPYQRFNEFNSGKGLGLYIVKTQVTLMKGDITVESQPGVGSKFRMHFPA